jgi:hypothetical protein
MLWLFFVFCMIGSIRDGQWGLAIIFFFLGAWMTRWPEEEK